MKFKMFFLNIDSNRLNYLIGLLLLSIVFFPDCKSGKRFKKEYYPGTTILKSEGFYFNDTPIDTIKRYSKEGWLEFIDVYTNGVLNGKCVSYYKNGVPSEVVNYKNGNENGRYISYRENGTKKVIGFFYNGKPVGDVYYFDTSNFLQSYNFFDFNKKALMGCKYDNNGKIIEGANSEFYLFDSLRVADGSNGADTVKILLLISHQPRTSMKVRIDNVESDGRVIYSKNIDADYQLGFYNNVINKNVDTIKEIGVRYDSVLNATKTFIIVRLIKDLR